MRRKVTGYFVKSIILVTRALSTNTIQYNKATVQIKNKVHHVNQLIEPDLMMYINMTFSKKTHSMHSTHHTPLQALHLAIQNILLAVNPFHCFFAKS